MSTTSPTQTPDERSGDAPSLDRRGYAIALAMLGLGAVLMIVAFGRTWSTTIVGGSGVPTWTVSLTGSDLAGAGTAIAVLSLAGVAGLSAARRRGRLVIGTLLALAGLAVIYVAIDFAIHWSTSTGLGGTILRVASERAGAPVSDVPTTVTQWWIVAAAGGLVVAAGGVLAVLRSSRWPEMGRRYERGAPNGTGAETTRSESVWEQLDRGVDPTQQDQGTRDWVNDPATDTMSSLPVEEEPR